MLAVTSSDGEQHSIEFLRRLAAGTAHDLNNILLVVIGCAELSLDDGSLSPYTRKRLHDILAATARASALTRQFLTLGQPPIVPLVAVDIGALLSSFESLLRLVVGDHIRLQLDPGPAPLWVLSDASQLEQVLLNLALNARDAMPTGGILTVTAGSVAGARGRLTVSDTGGGIDPAIRDRIYEPYITTKHDRDHSGLGLAVVRSIVERLGGAIDVATTVGAGTTFAIDLPLTDASGALSPPAPVTDASGAPSPPAPGPNH